MEIIADYLMHYPNFLIVGSLRFFASILILLSYERPLLQIISSGIIFGSLVVTTLRSPYGLDGAHQMNLVIFGGSFFYGILGSASEFSTICLWFIAIQVGMSYFVAGANKLVSTYWRSGRGLVGIFSTNMYGHPIVFKMLSPRKSLSKVLSWTVIIFEISFILVFFIELRVSILLLVLGALFHLANAWAMGLNGFFFAFVGTYPIVFYCTLYSVPFVQTVLLSRHT